MTVVITGKIARDSFDLLVFLAEYRVFTTKPTAPKIKVMKPCGRTVNAADPDSPDGALGK